jgi:hypothetical protein
MEFLIGFFLGAGLCYFLYQRKIRSLRFVIENDKIWMKHYYSSIAAAAKAGENIERGDAVYLDKKKKARKA